MYLAAIARMHNDRAAQGLMLNALAAQGTNSGIKDTYRSLINGTES